MTYEQRKHGDWSYCPACGGGIDTGYECNKCGRDWLEFHETRQELLDKCAARERAVRLEAAKQVDYYNDDPGHFDPHLQKIVEWMRQQAEGVKP